MSEVEIKYRILFIALSLVVGAGLFLFIKYIRIRLQREKAAHKVRQEAEELIWPKFPKINLTTKQKIFLGAGVLLGTFAVYYLITKTRKR